MGIAVRARLTLFVWVGSVFSSAFLWGLWAHASGSHAAPAAVGQVAARAAAPNAADEGDPLVQVRDSGTIDWRQGVITTSAGAAADLRMPSAAVARAGAERRARATARARLGALLGSLGGGSGQPLDAAAIARATDRATVDAVEYQSNGGVVLRLRCNFGDWAGTTAGTPSSPAREVPLLLSEARLQLTPELHVDGRRIDVRAAHYRFAGALPAGTHAIAAHADPAGGIVLDARLPADARGDSLALLIYFQRLLK